MRDFTVKQVQAAGPGRHRVSASLYLYVPPDGQGRRFIFRYTKPSTGRVTETGLGSFDVVSLAEARAKALEYRRMIAKGQDPVEAKRSQRTGSTTFASVAADYLAVATRRFRNANSAKNEQLLLFTHAAALGPQSVADIGTAHIDAALRPLWLQHPHQAKRALAAVLRVLRYAKAKGLSATSAADIRESMTHLLPHVNGAKRHFTAMDYTSISAFVRELRAAQIQGAALSPTVIEFLVLTAARENEVCGMKWSEIDWPEKVWVVPAERMKAGKEHRVPLSDRALKLLIRQRGPEQGVEQEKTSYVWPGRNGYGPVTGKAIYKYLTATMGVSATIHGFRAAFRTWAGNETNFDRVTAELCLAHAAGDAVELAYRRGDSLAKRRQLMEAWALYCEGSQTV
jgi:integrase